MLACAGNVAVVDALTAAGAALDAPSPAGTPLLWAAGSGQAATARALLVQGCQRDAVTDDRVGAALMAAAMGEQGPDWHSRHGRENSPKQASLLVLVAAGLSTSL